MQYMGGKFKIRKALGEFINKNLDGRDYYEPFVGAAWVLSEVKAENRFASDANPWLITMWKALQNGWVAPDEVSEEMYNQYNKDKPLDDPMTAFIGFGCSFGGKWFGGYARNKIKHNYAKSTKSSLAKLLSFIQSAKFSFRSYEKLSPYNALIYCDPPYRNTTGYGAVDTFDHNEFWQRAREWSENNIVLVSEYDAPEDFVCVLGLQSRMGLRNTKKEHEVRAEKVFAHESIVDQLKGVDITLARCIIQSSKVASVGDQVMCKVRVVGDVEQVKAACAEHSMRWVKARPSFLGKTVELVARSDEEGRVLLRHEGKELWWPVSVVQEVKEGKKVPTVEQVVEKLYELKDRKSVLAEEVAKIKAAEEKLENWLLWSLQNSGLTKMGVESPTVGKVTIFSRTKTSYRVGDWDTVLGYVKEHDAFDLLVKNVSSTAIKESFEQGAVIPGLEVFQEEVVSVRKTS